jgi:hypothetical protein
MHLHSEPGQCAGSRAEAPSEEAAADITVLFRPKGEAGSTTKGFNLQESKGLNDNGPLYNDILVCHNHDDYQGNMMGD